MTESQWLECSDPRRMLESLRPHISPPKLRLFGCACCRRVWQLFEDEACRRSIETGERFALGQADEAERARAANEAHLAIDRNFINRAAWRCSVLHHDDTHNAVVIASLVASAAVTLGQLAEAAAQAALVREIFGNPFEPIIVEADWLTWRDGTVPRMARRIHEERRFEDLPILADALEEAGCQQDALLDHCRRPASHVAGCWLLSILTSKW